MKCMMEEIEGDDGKSEFHESWELRSIGRKGKAKKRVKLAPRELKAGMITKDTWFTTLG